MKRKAQFYSKDFKMPHLFREDNVKEQIKKRDNQNITMQYPIINYRERKRNRLQNFDYSQNGCYFVTICSKNREKFFGEIENDKIILNEYGGMVKNFWLDIPNHCQNAQLDQFIVMPNHIHGIVIIENNYPVGNAIPNVGNAIPNVGNAIPNVGNADLRSLRIRINDRTKMYLSKIIHGFKSSVTREIHKKFDDLYFAWQKSFYDHIVRHEKSLNIIRQYIIYNPLKWENDRNNLYYAPHPNHQPGKNLLRR